MPFPFIAQLIIGIVINVIGYMLMPKPKQPKPPSVEDLEDPTAEAGRPIPVIFGSITVSGTNIIYYGDKSIKTREVGGKK